MFVIIFYLEVRRI